MQSRKVTLIFFVIGTARWCPTNTRSKHATSSQIQGQIQNQGILQPAVAQVPIQQLQGQVDLQQQIIHQNQFVNQQANLLGQPQNQPLMQQPAVNQQGMDQGVQGVDQNAFHNVVQNVPQIQA